MSMDNKPNSGGSEGPGDPLDEDAELDRIVAEALARRAAVPRTDRVILDSEKFQGPIGADEHGVVHTTAEPPGAS
jgi:hypothetical protein